MKRYFHKLTDEEHQALSDTGATWADVTTEYSQPAWCDYPGGLDGQMGCWSLTLRKIKSIEDCEDCKLIKV